MAFQAVALAGVLATPAVITAAESSGGFDPTTVIGTLITPVIVVVLLLMGKLHTDPDYRRLEDYAKSEHDERIRLQTFMTDKALPMAHRQTLVMEATLPLVEAQVRLAAARDANAGGE